LHPKSIYRIPSNPDQQLSNMTTLRTIILDLQSFQIWFI
jgi:hypothetical protein